MTARARGIGRRHGGHAAMRALALLLALIVPAGQALAAMHLHCALEHPLGRLTAHAAGEAVHRHAGHLATPDAVARTPEVDHGRVPSPATALFGEHQHPDGATSAHAGCCIGVSAGALLCAAGILGVDVRAERFDLPVPSGVYPSPFHEPPPRPQWRAHAPA